MIRRLNIGILFVIISAHIAVGQVVRGIFDFRDMDSSSLHYLDGSWEFFWKKLRSDIDPSDAVEYANVPGLWNDNDRIIEDKKNIGYATYRLKLFLPQKPENFALFVDDMYTSYRLSLNGKTYAQNGKIGRSKSEYKPEWDPQVVELNGLSGVNTIELELVNFHHFRGGISKSLIFGKKKIVHSYYKNRWWVDLIIACMFILVALFFFFRFTFISFDTSSFFFALFCLIYSYRFLGTNLYILNDFLDIPWNLSVRLEYLSLYLGPMTMGIYIQRLLPRDTSNILINILVVICLFFCALTLFPVEIYTEWNRYFLISMSVYFFYGFTVYISALINRRKASLYGFLAAFTLFTAFFYILFVYFNLIPEMVYLPVVLYFLFLILQSIQVYIVSHDKKMSILKSID